MAYVPINTPAFLLAYAGAISGMAVPGRIVDPQAVDYGTTTRVALAFAQAFDQAWNSTVVVNALEQITIPLVVTQQFQGRGPGDINANPNLTDPGNWTVDAKAAVALVKSGNLAFAAQGISPQAVPQPSATTTYVPTFPNKWGGAANAPNNVRDALDDLSVPSASDLRNPGALGPAASVQNGTVPLTFVKSGLCFVMAAFNATCDTVPAGLTGTINIDGFPGTIVDVRDIRVSVANANVECVMMAMVQLDPTVQHTLGFTATVSVGNITIPINRSRILFIELA